MNDRQMTKSEAQAWAITQKEAGRCAKLQRQIDSMTRERDVLYEQLAEARREIDELKAELSRVAPFLAIHGIYKMEPQP